MKAACDRQHGRNYLANELTVEQETIYLQHLETCDQCRRWLEAEAGSAEIWELAHSALADSGGVIVPSADAHERHETRAADVAQSILSPTDHPQAMGRIGAYEALGLVGHGGMGLVFKAIDPHLNRIVAIKVIDPLMAKVAAARQRFAREARAMAAVSHEHVVPIYAVSEHQGLPFFVMEYVPGNSLEQRLLKQGPLNVVETVRIALQAAQALDAAHRQGLVHRDIKPGNLLLQRGVDRVLVTDFGLARVADDASLTQSGMLAGTPQYMAPEHVKGEPSDARADLFSLGCVIYAMCSGHSPFRAETLYGAMQRIAHDTPRSLRVDHPHIPEWLDQLVMKLLAKDPSQRFPTAADLATALSDELSYLQNPTARAVPSRTWVQRPPSPILARWSRIGRRRLVISGLVLLAAAASATASLRWFSPRANQGVAQSSAKPDPPTPTVGESTPSPLASLPLAIDFAGIWQPTADLAGLRAQAQQLESDWLSAPTPTEDSRWAEEIQQLQQQIEQLQQTF